MRYRNFDTNLKASWAPVHKLNGSLGLDCCNSSIHILGYHITTKQQTASHVFAVTWVTFNHLIGWLKTHVCDLRDSQLLVVGFLSRDNRSIGGQREVNTWVWHQVGLLNTRMKNCSLLFGIKSKRSLHSSFIFSHVLCGTRTGYY